MNYFLCSCIDIERNDSLIGDNNLKSSAKDGQCPSDCTNLMPFLLVLFFITLLTALNQMPMLMVTLRSVKYIERSFALGFQLVIMRLLAYIPSPLIFGKAIDSTCQIWNKNKCDQIGFCYLYDRAKFRHIYGSIAAVYKFISLLLFICLWLVTRRQHFKQKSLQKNEISTILRASMTSLNSGVHRNSHHHHHSSHNQPKNHDLES
jgi:solute carrier organic anion transporter family, member 3A